MKIAPWYPPSPPDVPEDFAVPSGRYRFQVFVVLFCLVLFFFVYMALAAGCVFLIYKAFTIPLGKVDRGVIMLRVLLVAVPAMLFLFLFKGLFKRERVEKTLLVEITEDEHPKLFAFIRRLCDETGAPFPAGVFLSPEVNAAVFYNRSILSLILPAQKNLLIGLGLVNVLNLSEFKAVLAHEFGHFAQKSMKVGPYVYVANRIIADIVYGRDALDDLLIKWRSADIRVGFIAWGICGVLWGLRQILAGFFKIINFFDSALSRQMEFNADLMAVSVSGSDALINGLSRLSFAGESLGQAMEDLKTAADHHLYTSDLYHHQNHAASYLRRVRNDPHLGEPPPLPKDPGRSAQVFEPGDTGIPLMWATHPSNFDREENAKEYYIRTDIDDRSPWVLFEDPQRVREKVTRRFYRIVVKIRKDVAMTVAEDVQAFIDDEHAETTYDPRYYGLYDSRYLALRDLPELATAARDRPWDFARLAKAQRQLYGRDVKEWMKEHQLRLEEIEMLSGVEDGEVKLEGSKFKFRGRYHSRREVSRLFNKVDRELDEDQEWLAQFDASVFQIHYQMARQLGEKYAQELLDRYQFHLSSQKVLHDLVAQDGPVQAALQFLSGQHELEPEQFQRILATFREAHEALAEGMTTARELLVPALNNLKEGQPLNTFLLEKKMVHALGNFDDSLSGKWINKFLEQMGEVQDRLRRIHFKSLGAILALQENISRMWSDKNIVAAEPILVQVDPKPAPVPKK